MNTHLKVVLNFFALCLFTAHSKITPNGADGKGFIGLREGRFANKVCFITGGTSGIGEFAAYQLSKEGCAVIITGRREDRGQEVLKNILGMSKSSLNPKALFVKNDVTDYPAMASVIQTINKTWARLDGVFANAGQLSPPTTMDQLPLEAFQAVVNVNLIGAYNTMRESVPLLKQTSAVKKTPGGSIVFTSSILGKNTLPLVGAYSVTKHALEGLKKAAAAELFPSGIRVNNLNPTFTLTEIIEVMYKVPRFKVIMDETTVGGPHGNRIAPASEPAAGAVYLLSDDSIMVNSHSFMMDGGLTDGWQNNAHWTRDAGKGLQELGEMMERNEL